MTAFTIAFLALSDQEKGTGRRFDLTGFIFIAIAIGAFQLMFDRGQRLDWFESAEILIELGLVIVCFYLFLVHMMTARQPLFEGATFRDRNFAIGIILATVMGMLQYTPMVLFPPLLQELRGYPDAIVGYLISARGMGNFLSFLIVAQFTRYSPKLCLFTGLVLQAMAGLWMASLDINMSTADVFWTNLLHGLGFGLAYTPMAVLTFSTLPLHLLTQGNAVFSLLRMLGSSVFISISLVVFFNSAAEASFNLNSLVTAIDIRNLGAWITLFGSPSEAALQLKVGAEIQRQAAMVGYINAFYLLAFIAAAAAPLAVFFRVRASA